MNITKRLITAALFSALLMPCTLAVAAHHEEAEKSVDIEKQHQIERECEKVIYTFLRRFENEHAKAADLFTKNGSSSFSTTGEPTVGRDKIREAWSGIDSGKVELNALVASNLLVQADSEDKASAFCYVRHYQFRFKSDKHEEAPVQPPAGPMMSWTFEFEFEDGVWKISKLEVRGYYVR